MQPKCTHCGNTQCKNGTPSVHVLDVANGQVVKQQFVCEAAAEQLGILEPKMPAALQLPGGTLQNLLAGLKSVSGPQTKLHRPGRGDPGGCAGCGMTLSDFKARGRLGCPRCYDTFRDHLARILEKVHDERSHRGRFPGRPASPPPQPANVADLRRRLEEAVFAEDYETAARLRDELKRATGHPEGERG